MRNKFHGQLKGKIVIF